MSELFEDPPRWREHADQSNLTERAFGQALRAIGTPPPLSGLQMARLAADLRPPRVHRSRVLIAVSASFILGLATAASAAHLNILPRWLSVTARPPLPAATPAPRSHGEGRTLRPHAAVVASATPTAESAAEPPAVAPAQGTLEFHPARVGQQSARPIAIAPGSRPDVMAEQAAAVRFADPLAPPSPPPSAHTAMLEPSMPVKPASSQIVESKPAAIGEPGAAKVLVDAIRALRVDGAPGSALALLDRHAILLATSPYRHEALLIRVDALLALKRERELLRLLDGAALADVAASRTLLVTRGQLRAATNRCQEAVTDFDRVLAEAGRADRQALLGRATCRERLGDVGGARADRERYRQEASGAP